MQKKSWGQFLSMHLLLAFLLSLLCIWGCPFARLLCFNCPGCGLTRAWLCFLKGNISGALKFHPLFLPAPFFLWLAVHQDLPQLKRWKTEVKRSTCFFTSCFFLHHLFRAFVFSGK